MDKDKEKEKRGISLRKKRSGKPKISAPKQISGPLPINTTTDTSRPKPNGPAGGGGGLPSGPRPRPRPQGADATADLIQRRYSTRFANAPSEYGADAPPMPSMPKVPGAGKFAVQPPRPSMDERPSLDERRRIKVDVKALSNPNLKPDQCMDISLCVASRIQADMMLYRCARRARWRRGRHDPDIPV